MDVENPTICSIIFRGFHHGVSASILVYPVTKTLGWLQQNMTRFGGPGAIALAHRAICLCSQKYPYEGFQKWGYPKLVGL